MGWQSLGSLVVRNRHVRAHGPHLILCPLVLLCWTLGDARSPAQFPLDLIPTYVAGKLWLAGQVHAVYHDGAWLPASGAKPEWLAMTHALRIQLPDTAFTYSPVYLALFTPLIALLRPLQFYWVFATLTALAALQLGRESARLAGVERGVVPWVVALGCALSFPCSYAALLGQNVVLAALLVVLSLRAFEQGRPRLGLLLALLACAFKPWCLLVYCVLGLAARWRAAYSVLAAYLVVFMVAPRIVLPGALVDGYERTLEELPEISVLAFNNVSLRALIARTQLLDWTPQVYSWSQHGVVSGGNLAIELLLALAVGGVYLVWARKREAPFIDVGSESMALVLLGLGVCWSHYLVFALPLVVRSLLSKDVPPTARALGLLLSLWLWHMMSAAAPILPAMRPPLLWAVVYSAPLVLTVLLVLVLARGRRATPSGATSTQSGFWDWGRAATVAPSESIRDAARPELPPTAA